MNSKIAKYLGYNHLVELAIPDEHYEYTINRMCYVKDIHSLIEDNLLLDNWIRGVDYEYENGLDTSDLLKILQKMEKEGCSITLEMCVGFTCRIFDTETMKNYYVHGENFDKVIEECIIKYLSR